MRRKHLLSIIGGRPQFIKTAVLTRTLRGRTELEHTIVDTGQHYDHSMSSIFVEELDIPPPIILGVHGGAHAEMTGRMMIALDPVLADTKPDIVLVYGDTNSTVAGALTAAKQHLAVAHIEAGLRSFNRNMPEEINRIVADHLSDILFCPTQRAVANLTREGLGHQVLHVGDVMADLAKIASTQFTRSNILEKLHLQEKHYVTLTIHRAENTDDKDRLVALIDYVRHDSNGLEVVMPIHPRTRDAIEKFGIKMEGVTVTPPVAYTDMGCLIKGSERVYTDSGGLQKEAYFHEVSCVTLRDETEWVETIACGWNRLWTQPTYQTRRPIRDYGEGDAGIKIAATLAAHLE